MNNETFIDSRADQIECEPSYRDNPFKSRKKNRSLRSLF